MRGGSRVLESSCDLGEERGHGSSNDDEECADEGGDIQTPIECNQGQDDPRDQADQEHHASEIDGE